MKIDTHIIRQMEELFQDSEARVVTALKVSMLQPGSTWTVARAPKQLKSRILCITAKRSKRQTSRGFRCTLHVVKQDMAKEGHLQFQVRKSWALKLLTKIESLTSTEADSESFFGLTFTNTMGSGLTESRLTYGVRNSSDRALLLACLHRLVAKNENHIPFVIGADVADLERLSRGEGAAELMGEFGTELLQEDGEIAADSAGTAAHGGPGAKMLRAGTPVDDDSAITSKEERDLQALMADFKLGIADVDEFLERLGKDLRTKETQNIHSILEDDGAQRPLLKELDGAVRMLDDMEAQMAVYNSRLRHMKEDMKAIELRNNKLEITARNSESLLSSLGELLEHLDLSEDAEAVLVNAEFGNERDLERVLAAAWEVHGALERLNPGAGGFGEGVLRMKAVRQRRDLLASKVHNFVERAAVHLVGEFSKSVLHSSIEEVQALQAEELADFKLGVLSNAKHHQRLRKYIGLVEIINVLDPRRMDLMRSEYIRTFNLLLRRQMQGCASAMRQAAKLAPRTAPEANLVASRRPASMKPIQAHQSFARGVRRFSSQTFSRHKSAPPAAPHPGGRGGVVSPPGINSPHGDGTAHSLVNSQSKKGFGGQVSMINLKGGAFEVEPRALDEAFCMVLDTFVPLLLQECDFAVEILLLSRSHEEHRSRKMRFSEAGTSVALATSSTRSTARAARNITESTGRIQSSVSCEPDEIGPQGHKFVESLLDGVEHDLLRLVDKGQQDVPSCIPMLSATLRHQAKVAIVPHALPLQKILTECEKRLRDQLEQYVAEAVANIAKFEPGVAMSSSSSVKGVHVASFIRAFGPFVDRLEDLFRTCDSEGRASGRPSATDVQEGDSASIPRAGGTFGNEFAESRGIPEPHGEKPLPETPASINREASRPSFVSSFSNEDELEDRLDDLRPVVSSGPVDTQDQRISLRARFVGAGGTSIPAKVQVRSILDDAYQRLLGVMMATIERLAASDSKYGNKLRVENYMALLDVISPAAIYVPVLTSFRDRLMRAQENAVQGYVREQLEYCRLWALLSFSERLEYLLPDVGPEDVKFQLHFTVDDITRLLSTTMAGAEKKLGFIRARIAKHFADQPPAFVDRLWNRCSGALLARYQRLETQISLCYSGLEVTPSSSQLQAMLTSIR